MEKEKQKQNQTDDEIIEFIRKKNKTKQKRSCSHHSNIDSREWRKRERKNLYSNRF